MKEGKYIIFQDGSARVFNPWKIHAEEAQAEGKTPIRAGFFKTENHRIVTYGRSESLNLDSREADSSTVAPLLINMK